MFKNISKGVCLLSIIALFSCSDSWDDHYKEGDYSDLKNDNLYELIKSHDDLSIFNQMLVKSGYDQILSQSQSYTVWAPIDEALSGFDTTDIDLVTKTVGNHISRGKVTTEMLDENDISLMNSKQVVMSYTGDSYYFDIAHVAETNNVANNGLLHTLNEFVPYRNNIYELLGVYPEVDSLADYIYSFQVKEFDPERSVELGIDDLGQPIYDSAFIYSNEVLDYMGDLDQEGENYLSVLLTNEAWVDGYDRISKYLNIPDFQGGEERKQRLIDFYLTAYLTFDLDQQDVDDYLLEDSLLSNTGRYFYNPSQWLDNTTTVDVSNGYAHISDTYPHEDTAFIFIPIVVEAERTYKRENANNSIVSRTGYGTGYDISDNAYIAANSTSTSSNSSVTFTIPNTLSATYNIYCVLPPHNIIDESNLKSSRLKFRLNYTTNTGARGKSFTPDNNETLPDQMTKMFVAQWTFDYANMSEGNLNDVAQGYTDPVVTLKVENVVKTSEIGDSSAYTRDMLIDCLILEPVLE